MKKIGILIFCLMLVLGMTITVSAETTATMSGIPSSLAKDETATVTVSLSGTPTMTSAFVQIQLGEGLSLVSGQWLKSGTMADFKASNNHGVLALGGAGTLDGDVLQFVIKGVDASTAQSVDVNFTFKNGSTEVGRATVSDTIKGEDQASTIVKEWGMTLNDEIVVKFNMIITPEIQADAGAYVEVQVGTRTTKVPVSQVSGPFQVSVHATQMADTITLCIVDGTGARSDSDSFTVRQYCDTILGDEQYTEYHDLVKEMLNYGSAAQKYFGHNTGTLAGEGITDAGQQPVPTTGGEYTLNDQINGLDCKGASLVYRDRIALRYYFNGSLTGCTFAVNGVPSDLQVNANENYVEVGGILPQDLDRQVILTVTDAQGNELNITYCPMNYIVRMSQKGQNGTKELVKALYNYHLAAKAHSK